MSITPISGNQAYVVSINVGNDARNIGQTENQQVKDVTPELLSQIQSSLLKNCGMPPLLSDTCVAKEAQLDTLQTLQSLSPQDIATDSLALMKIFQECAKQMRQTAREQRHAELQSQVAALNSAADKMKDAADKRLVAGIVQGVMGIVGGCIQIGSGMAQIGQAGAALKETKQSIANEGKAKTAAQNVQNSLEASNGAETPASLGQQLSGEYYAKQARMHDAAAMELSSKAQATGQIGQGINAITSSASGLAVAAINHAADLDEVEKTRLETEAKKHETNYQQANEIMQNALDVIRDMKEMAQATEQARNETNRGIARNI